MGSEVEAAQKLLVFSDYVCPYCYLAERVVERVRERTDVAYDMAAYELWPAGVELPSADAAWIRHAWLRSVLPLAEELGVAVQQPAFTTRTRKAHEAVAYARAEDAGAALHAAVFRAYWDEGRDIGRIDVLVEIGTAVGLDPTGLKVALDIDQWTARVEQDERLARQLRLGGVPAYVLQGMERAELRVGLQRHEELRTWLGTRDDI